VISWCRSSRSSGAQPSLGRGVEPEFPGLRVIVGDLSPQTAANRGEDVDPWPGRGGPGRDTGRPGFRGYGGVAVGDEPQGGAGRIDPCRPSGSNRRTGND
jgi:hypothetical protein